MKKSSRDKLNLFFSAFLVIGYIICSYFFMALTSSVSTGMANLIQVVVFVLFGLLIFYATRVGDGIPVKRFSPIVLCVLDVPALFIIIASLAPAFPLHAALSSQPVVMLFACIALGYGIPYAFLSGFEMVEAVEESDTPVEGGIVQELEEIAQEEAVETVEELADDEVATVEDIEELEAIDGADAQ